MMRRALPILSLIACAVVVSACDTSQIEEPILPDPPEDGCPAAPSAVSDFFPIEAEKTWAYDASETLEYRTSGTSYRGVWSLVVEEVTCNQKTRRARIAATFDGQIGQRNTFAGGTQWTAYEKKDVLMYEESESEVSLDLPSAINASVVRFSRYGMGDTLNVASTFREFAFNCPSARTARFIAGQGFDGRTGICQMGSGSLFYTSLIRR